MSQPPPGIPIAPGTLSPDGAWVWNGNHWIQNSNARFSPDRAYIWNGNQWIPTAQGQPTVPTQSKGHALRNAGIGVLGCVGLIVVLVIIGSIAGALGGGTSGRSAGGTLTSSAPTVTPSPPSSPSAAQANGCSPQPCASAYSLTVRISGLNRNEPAGTFFRPEAGNHLVLMQITMHNDGGRDTKTINPFDFKLRDAAGVAHTITFSDAPGCDTWSAVDLAPGATYGPKPLCFEAAGDPSGSLTLLWSPGLFVSTQEIHL